MFNFKKKKALPEQIAIFFIKTSINGDWIKEDIRSIDPSRKIDNNIIEEFFHINIFCAHVATMIHFKNDTKTSERVRKMLFHRSRFVFSQTPEREKKHVERVGTYLSIFLNSETNDEYYEKITKCILNNIDMDYSSSKAAGIAGKLHGLITVYRNNLKKIKVL